VTRRSLVSFAAASALLAGLALFAFAAVENAGAFPVTADTGLLPVGTELNEDALDQPTEIFHSDLVGGKHSYLVNLGDMAFSSPLIFGGLARQSSISCNTCHQSGAGNPKLFVPGLSTHPGNFDTTSAIFQPKADNGVLDPVTPPSLRGARYLYPYGHDGRFASLRDFVRNVIVNEFAGPEPSPAILDGLVAYIQDIEFLPNKRIDSDGHLALGAGDPEKRGEALFSKSFPNDPGMSCVSCHVPSAAFADHVQHDIGSGGYFKTPTLRGANFNAPYFHDGRFTTYEQVINYFDHAFKIHYTPQDHADLIAYLTAIGDGDQPFTRDSAALEIDEATRFISVLAVAIPAHDQPIIQLTADTVGIELRELAEFFPERKDTSVKGGDVERTKARDAARGLVLSLRAVELAVRDGDFDEAEKRFASFKADMAAAQPILQAAEPWSLFNPDIRATHFAALRNLAAAAGVKLDDQAADETAAPSSMKQ
jgi:cytochrome c peroxidase